MATPNPNLIYRTDVTSSLTYAQLDGNFAYLSQSISDITSVESASYAVTASYALNGGSPINSSSFATTSSNTFKNNQTISGSILISGSIIPNTDGVSATSSFNLGSITNAWKDIYVSNGTINFLDGTGSIQATLSSTEAGLALPLTLDLATASKIESIPSSSGDGNGYTTLELTPDTDLGTDQYIILDPTGPNHIHIRAGGAIDDSTADLIIGGEDINLVVSDASNEIEMKRKSTLFVTDYTLTSGSGYSTAVWSSSGSVHIITLNGPTIDAYTATSLIIPNPPSFFSVIDSSSNYFPLEVLSTNTPVSPNPIVLTVNQAPPTNPISLDQVYFEINDYADSYVRVNSDVTIEAVDDLRMYSRDVFSLRNYSTTDSVDIITQYGGNENMWEFTPGGDTLFPGDISTPGTITADSFTGSLEGTASYVETAQTSSYYNGATIDAEIYISQTSNDQACSLLFTTLTSSGYNYPSFDTTPTLTYNPNGATGTLSLTGSMLINALGSQIILSNLPTSEPSTSGQLWLSGSVGSNSKILCIRD